MKKFLLKGFYAILFLLPLFSVAQLNDNFSDGDFTNNPTWVGNTSSFEIVSDSLHSNGPQASSTIYLSTANTLIDSAEWNFLIHLDFNPSSTNYVKVYLVSDQADLSAGLNGYYIQLGETGSNDSLDIFKQTGTTPTKVFTGTSAIITSATSSSLRIKISRHAGGNWDVFADKTGGTSFSSEGSFTDNSYTTTSSFGVVGKYSTASRYNLYYFDDFKIDYLHPDTIKPTVASVNVLTPFTIDVKFSEPIGLTSAQNTLNYSVNSSIGNPIAAVRDAGDLSLVHLTFLNQFQNATNYILSISGVQDVAGNTMNAFSFPFAFYNAGSGDVLIHEIMADPDPAVGLKSAEYVELYNKTAFPISLNGWTFSDGSSTVSIPSVTILPDSFLLLCALDNVDSFPSSISIATLALPSLNNSGDNLLLRDNFGNTIHAVNYLDSWYNSSSKQNGGWSLEMIDANNPCSGKENWSASIDASGGTPGRRNSITGNNPDTIRPQLVRASLQDNHTLLLYFSEAITASSASVVTNFLVNNSIGNPLTVSAFSLDYTTLQLSFTSTFVSGTVYTIRVSNLSDCSGNTIGMSDSARFAIGDTVHANDLVINEILFNPRTGGYDFVELYNRSNKVIDLKGLDILENDYSNPQSILEQATISTESYLLFPQEYVVLTESPENILLNYNVENPNALLQVPSLPNYDDNQSICILKVHNGETLDSLAYDHNWHFALLDVEDGVSLERIDFNKPTQDKSNWHSSASTVGFGTPTYQNSQYSETGITSDEIKIEPEVFTPDNDGDKDFTFINYKFTEAGYVLNAKVYDAKGREIRTLAKSELLSSEGKLMWDGIDDDNQKARVGIYIVYLEVFNLQGKVKKLKKQVVLGARLN